LTSPLSQFPKTLSALGSNMDIKNMLCNGEVTQLTHKRLTILPPTSSIHQPAPPDQPQPFCHEPHYTTSQYEDPVQPLHYVNSVARQQASTGHHAQFQPSVASPLIEKRPLSHQRSHKRPPNKINRKIGRKIGKWTPQGMKWDDISKNLPGRSAKLDENRKHMLAHLYNR
jgi:hypothetical protein